MLLRRPPFPMTVTDGCNVLPARDPRWACSEAGAAAICCGHRRDVIPLALAGRAAVS